MIHIEDEAFHLFASKLRMVEDSIARALDQLEEDVPNEASWHYVRQQVMRSHAKVMEAAALMLKAIVDR